MGCFTKIFSEVVATCKTLQSRVLRLGGIALNSLWPWRQSLPFYRLTIRCSRGLSRFSFLLPFGSTPADCQPFIVCSFIPSTRAFAQGAERCFLVQRSAQHSAVGIQPQNILANHLEVSNLIHCLLRFSQYSNGLWLNAECWLLSASFPALPRKIHRVTPTFPQGYPAFSSALPQGLAGSPRAGLRAARTRPDFNVELAICTARSSRDAFCGSIAPLTICSMICFTVI